MFVCGFQQEIYVDHPYVHVTHAHLPLRSETPKQSLKVLREILQQPLSVLGFSDKHRSCLLKPGAGKTTQIIYKYLPQSPDIMVVRAADGTVLHFAPAMLLHLPESRAFSSGCLSSDQMRQVSLRCPHPQLMSLSMPGCHYLSTLFCPVLSKVIESSNVLRDAPVSKSTSSMLAVNGITQPGARDSRDTGAKASVAGAQGNSKVPMKGSVLPASPLYMMPLSNDGMQALMLQYLVPCVFDRCTTNSEGGISDPKEAVASIVPSAINVLPDHARLRPATSSAQVDTSTASAVDDYRKLRCIYVLLPDDKVAENAAAAANEVTTPRRGSSTNVGSASELPKSRPPAVPCYYLVQVYEMPDRSSGGGTGAGVGSETVEGSELDDRRDDNINTTFSLTQQATQASSAAKSSIFGRSNSYHLDDDILRAVVLDELRAALNGDVVIAPPPVKATKDGKQQGMRLPNLGTDSGVKKGAISTLSLITTSQQHNQVVQEDQDEGGGGDNHNDDSNSSAGVNSPMGPAGHGGAASKRRWDPNVLSNVCRWRSCLCDSALQRVGKTNTFKQKQLCSYHLEMKDFLDGKGGKSNSLESAKYLPRKAPNFNSSAIQEKKRDMMTIRAASTLLQELWDGKLRATVRSFAKKIVRDMSQRVFLEAANTAFMIAHPLYMLHLAGNTDRDSNSSRLVNPFSVKAYIAARPAMEVVVNSVVPAQPTWAIWKSKQYHDRCVAACSASNHCVCLFF